jgi:hypothetical protein
MALQVDPEVLPHWTRVAFAARCARRVLPLFAEAWPEANPERQAALELAITLAERSASDQRPTEGLREAVIAAIMVAGRAYMQHHCPEPVKDDDPGPTDRRSALIASFVAKAAEHAAEAANAPPDASAQHVLEAFHFALDALRAAGRLGQVEVLEADFEAAAGSTPRRPWWRFW